MSNQVSDAARALPDRPNLRHLKDQAKDLLKAGNARSFSDAQFQIAREYGFTSWPKLKAHIDSLEEAEISGHSPFAPSRCQSERGPLNQVRKNWLPFYHFSLRQPDNERLHRLTNRYLLTARPPPAARSSQCSARS